MKEEKTTKTWQVHWRNTFQSTWYSSDPLLNKAVAQEYANKLAKQKCVVEVWETKRTKRKIKLGKV